MSIVNQSNPDFAITSAAEVSAKVIHDPMVRIFFLNLSFNTNCLLFLLLAIYLLLFLKLNYSMQNLFLYVLSFFNETNQNPSKLIFLHAYFIIFPNIPPSGNCLTFHFFSIAQ